MLCITKKGDIVYVYGGVYALGLFNFGKLYAFFFLEKLKKNTFIRSLYVFFLQILNF